MNREYELWEQGSADPYNHGGQRGWKPPRHAYPEPDDNERGDRAARWLIWTFTAIGGGGLLALAVWTFVTWLLR